MNPESLEIIDWVAQSWPQLEHIQINTNGGARNSEWWRSLARTVNQAPQHMVEWAIDGLAGTHELYRQRTLHSQVIKNAEAFIGAGGAARWIMTIFRENQDQVEACRAMSQDLGFKEFVTRRSPRHDSQGRTRVFDRNLENTHNLHRPGATDTDLLSPSQSQEYLARAQENLVKFYQFAGSAWYRDRYAASEVAQRLGPGQTSTDLVTVDCIFPRRGSIYVDSFGGVWPCCFLGEDFENEQRMGRHTKQTYLSDRGLPADSFIKDQRLGPRTMTEILADSDSFVNHIEQVTSDSFVLKQALTCGLVCQQGPGHFDAQIEKSVSTNNPTRDLEREAQKNGNDSSVKLP